MRGVPKRHADSAATTAPRGTGTGSLPQKGCAPRGIDQLEVEPISGIEPAFSGREVNSGAKRAFLMCAGQTVCQRTQISADAVDPMQLSKWLGHSTFTRPLDVDGYWIPAADG